MYTHALPRTLPTLIVFGLLSLTACAPDDLCPGEKYEYDKTHAVCVPAGSRNDPGDPEGSDGDQHSDESGDNDAGSEESDGETVPFGATCSGDSECGPGICVNMPIMVGCTQTACKDGEEHAGICPSDWMCLSDPSSGQSACIKL